MIPSKSWRSCIVLTILVAAPLGVMAILTITVLWPNLNNPESRFYSSGIGYPARQRSAGKPIEVQTVAVELTTVEDSLAAPGESVPLQEVNVRPEVTGIVAEVYVLEGQEVRRGQPLVRLHQSDFKDRVKRAQNDLAIAQAQLQALEISSRARLRELENDVRAARARRDEAKARLEEIDSLAEEQRKNRIETARIKLETAKKRLEESRILAEEGGIARFQLYEAEDNYADSKRELLDAQQGIFDDQNNRFINRDFYLTREKELIDAQRALKLARETIDKELDNARLTVKTRRIELEEATRDLNRTVIYASTDGLVSKLNIHSGDFINTGWGYNDPLLTLTTNIVFKAFIDQARLNDVHIGDKAAVRLIAYSGRIFSGRVIKINPTVETETIRSRSVGVDRQYTYSVWITVDEIQMAPGLQGYVQFDQGKSTLVVPESAVTHLSGGEGMVMVAQEGRAVVKKVKLGKTFDNQREVLEGLRLGEQVVLHPRALEPGDALAIAPLEDDID